MTKRMIKVACDKEDCRYANSITWTCAACGLGHERPRENVEYWRGVLRLVSCPKCDAENFVLLGLWTCSSCGNQNISGELCGTTPLGPLAEFDAALQTITQRRGATYGHPSVDFANVAALKSHLPPYGDTRLRHIAEMICVKLARLSHDPTHVDSLVDIAGYARTWAMILERDYVNKSADKANLGGGAFGVGSLGRRVYSPIHEAGGDPGISGSSQTSGTFGPRPRAAGAVGDDER